MQYTKLKSSKCVRGSGLFVTSVLMAAASVACGAESLHEEEYGEIASEISTYQVGPGRPFANLQALAGLLNPGDIVDVYGGTTYSGGIRLTRSGTAANKITIRGVRVNGARPILSGGTNTIEFAGNHYVFQGFDVTRGSSRCVYHHAHGITIRDTVVHDCPAHGILGADSGSGSLVLENSEIYRSGSGTNLHQIYMATDESMYPGSVFRMQNCYVHDGVGGNNVKSRAERNEIYNNWLEGAYYHELELIGPDGQAENLAREDSDVVGNVLFQGYVTRSHYPIRIGGDGTAQTWGRYRFVNNSIVLGNATTSAAFRVFDGIESVEMHNNVLYRQGGGAVTVLRDVEAVWKNGRTIAGSQNWTTTGSSSIPSTWSGTRTGTNPGFIDVANRNVRLNASSALIGLGTSTPTSPSGHPFPSALSAPAFEPPLHAALAAPTVRPKVGVIDIGAYEQGSVPAPPATTVPPPATAPPPTIPPPATIVLAPIADAYVESDLQANANFGSVNPLLLKTGALVAFNREAYFKFDISSVSQIGSVKLRLFAALSSAGNGPIVTSVYSAADTSWSEGTITWNNKPPRGASALGNISITTTAYAWYEIDLTSLVRAEKSLGRTSLTLALSDPVVTDSRVLIASREAPSSKPELVVRQ